MTLDEVKRTFPIGARLWHSGFASWCEVYSHYESSAGVGWVAVTRLDNKTNWYVPPERLFADEKHTPIPVACGPGGGAHEQVQQPVVEPKEPEQHVAGHSPEHVTEEAWKAFKEML